jgi:hypothetical protein
MLRWKLQTLAVVFGLTLANGVLADEPTAPPAKPTKPAPTPPPPPVVTAALFRVATPYNATFVNRTPPNVAYNRPEFTLPCENCHQNFDSFVPAQPDCIKRIFGRSDCGGGCKGKGCHYGEFGCGQGNSATMTNSYNFVWGGSRSFFGETSREFFERPASVDQVRHKWNPVPVIYRQDNKQDLNP